MSCCRGLLGIKLFLQPRNPAFIETISPSRNAKAPKVKILSFNELLCSWIFVLILVKCVNMDLHSLQRTSAKNILILSFYSRLSGDAMFMKKSANKLNQARTQLFYWHLRNHMSEIIYKYWESTTCLEDKADRTLNSRHCRHEAKGFLDALWGDLNLGLFCCCWFFF